MGIPMPLISRRQWAGDRPYLLYLTPPSKRLLAPPQSLSQAQSDGCGAAQYFLPLPEAVPKEQAARREGAST